MEQNTDVRGSCLCNSISYQFKVTEKEFDVCHCGMCRKWSGGPGFGVTAKSEPVFTGIEHLKTYSSSEWAERGFCGKCGTHLFYRLKDKSFINFQLGSLEKNDSFKFNLQIYTDCKPNNYSFFEKTKMMTEADVIKAFSNKK
jgi:hypothetical protein